jgi:hypothetical protein
MVAGKIILVKNDTGMKNIECLFITIKICHRFWMLNFGILFTNHADYSINFGDTTVTVFF